MRKHLGVRLCCLLSSTCTACRHTPDVTDDRLVPRKLRPALLSLGRFFQPPHCHDAGDVDEALALVHASDGIARAKDVAVVQAEKAMDAVLTLKQSPARDALVQLAHKIVNRNH